MTDSQIPLAGLFELYATERTSYLDRGRKCAELTIPSLLPPNGFSKSSDLYVPYQSVGARGVNTLANKLLIALLPPNTPFFRLLIDDYTMTELTQDEEARSKVEEALSTHERAIMTDISKANLTSPVVEALKLLIVSGNALMTFNKQGRSRVFRLDSYVVRRDHDGKVLEVIIKEKVKYGRLDDDLKALLDESRKVKSHKPDAEFDLYTVYRYEDGKFITYQEIDKILIPGTEGDYKEDDVPFLALRWTQIDGEHYGRGHVEEYIGDLNALEGLSQALLEGSLAAARLIFLLKPGSTTKAKTLNDARNASVVTGDEDDIGTLQANKGGDFRVVREQIENIEQRLSFAFLMNTAIQRNAERVTAEEIRFMAGELEDALGGTYSLLADEFQLPLVKMRISYLTRANKIPKLPKDIVEPSIVTGLEALGRGHDLTKLDLFLNKVAALGPEGMARINPGDLIARIGASLGIDTDGLVKTEEQVMQEQQQALAQQQLGGIAQAAAPQIAKAATEAPPE